MKTKHIISIMIASFLFTGVYEVSAQQIKSNDLSDHPEIVKDATDFNGNEDSENQSYEEADHNRQDWDVEYEREDQWDDEKVYSNEYQFYPGNSLNDISIYAEIVWNTGRRHQPKNPGHTKHWEEMDREARKHYREMEREARKHFEEMEREERKHFEEMAREDRKHWEEMEREELKRYQEIEREDRKYWEEMEREQRKRYQ